MVFSLMGANGYKFAENIGLQPVREQIMNPEKKILQGGFIGKMRLDSSDYRKLDRPIVFMCRTGSLPFWIVPMRGDNAVFLSCGGTEPIDKLVMNPKEANIPFGSLVGWLSRRFNSSSSIGGTVGEEGNDCYRLCNFLSVNSVTLDRIFIFEDDITLVSGLPVLRDFHQHG